MKLPPFDWDDKKAASNLLKHYVSFAEAATVLQNLQAAEFPDAEHSIKENRWIAIGHSNRGRILVVCYTEKGNVVRIISARKADKQEKRAYEERKTRGR